MRNTSKIEIVNHYGSPSFLTAAAYRLFRLRHGFRVHRNRLFSSKSLNELIIFSYINCTLIFDVSICVRTNICSLVYFSALLRRRRKKINGNERSCLPISFHRKVCLVSSIQSSLHLIVWNKKALTPHDRIIFIDVRLYWIIYYWRVRASTVHEILCYTHMYNAINVIGIWMEIISMICTRFAENVIINVWMDINTN